MKIAIILLLALLLMPSVAMAQTKISQMPNGGPTATGDTIPVVRGGVNYQTQFPAIVPSGATGSVLYQTATGSVGSIALTPNSVLGELTTGNPVPFVIPPCSSTGNALNYTAGVGVGCTTFSGAPSGGPGSVQLNGGSGSFGSVNLTPGTILGEVTSGSPIPLVINTGLSTVTTGGVTYLNAVTTSGSGVPGGIYPQLQYNTGMTTFGGLTGGTLAAYAAHDTVMNGLAYDPRNPKYGGICGGFNIFSTNGSQTVFSYTIPFTGSSSTDNSHFFVFYEKNDGSTAAVILNTTQFSVTGVNSGSGTITLNSAPPSGDLLFVLHDDGPAFTAASVDAAASGGYISVPNDCTIYSSQTLGTQMTDGVNLVGQNYAPNYTFGAGAGFGPILYVIPPKTFEPEFGFNVTGKQQQFFEGFTITSNVPGVNTSIGFGGIPALIGASGSSGAGQNNGFPNLPGIVLQNMTVNYGIVGFGSPVGVATGYIGAQLRFNNFTGNVWGVSAPLSDAMVIGNDFVNNGTFANFGSGGGMQLIADNAGAQSGAMWIDSNRFEFNKTGMVITAGVLTTMSENQFDGNNLCGIDFGNFWNQITITGGWFRGNSNGGNGSTAYPGTLVAGEDADLCFNSGAGSSGLYMSNVNFLTNYGEGSHAPIGQANATTPAYVIDINSAPANNANITITGGNAQFVAGNNGASVVDFAIYRQGQPLGLQLDINGQAVAGGLVNGQIASQVRGLPTNSWSSYYAFGDPYLTYPAYFQWSAMHEALIGSYMNVSPSVYSLTSFNIPLWECNTVDSEIFPNYTPTAGNNPLVTWTPSAYDPTFGGGGSPQHEADTNLCREAALTWMATRQKDKVYAQSATTTGSWGNFAGYGGAIGITSTTQNSAATLTITTNGGPIYLGWELQGTSTGVVTGGTFQYTLDSTTTGSVATGGNGAFTYIVEAGSQAPAVTRIPVGTPGGHTLALSVTSTTSAANPVTILGAWTPPGKAYVGGNPTVFIAGQPYELNDQQSTATAAWNEDIYTQANQLLSDGLAVYFVNTRNYVNSTLDMSSTGVNGSPYSMSAQGQLHLADAYMGLIQPKRNSDGAIDPRDYGASCNNQMFTGTYQNGAQWVVNTTKGSPVITISNNEGGIYQFQPGTATQNGGGDVGKQITIFNSGGNGDVGPTTYILSVSTTSGGSSATLGENMNVTTNAGYAFIGGYPSNPADPSTAKDDTAAFYQAELAASTLYANAGVSAVGGSHVYVPPNCLIHNLQAVSNVKLQGNMGGIPYGANSTPNSSLTYLNVAANGYVEDAHYGINITGAVQFEFKDFAIRSVTFPFPQFFADSSLSCIGGNAYGGFGLEQSLLDHVAVVQCPLGFGDTMIDTVPVSFNASIAPNSGNDCGSSAVSPGCMTVLAITSSNVEQKYGLGYLSTDWISKGLTVTGTGVTANTRINSLGCTTTNQQGNPGCGEAGVYGVSLSQTVTTEAMSVGTQQNTYSGTIRDSWFGNDGQGVLGQFSDATFDNDVWTGGSGPSTGQQFAAGLYLGPEYGSNGNGSNRVIGGRFEEAGGIIIDTSVDDQITGTQFQTNGGCALTTRGTVSYLQITGAWFQGNGKNPFGACDGNNVPQVIFYGNTSHVDFSGVSWDYHNNNGGTQSNYMLETATGFSGDYLSFSGGDASACCIVAPFLFNATPTHRKFTTQGIPPVDTTIIPTHSGLSETSFSGGIYSATALAGLTGTGTLVLSGLPTNGVTTWNCQGGDITNPNVWPMSATTSSSCSLAATVTSGDKFWISGQPH